MHSYNDLGSCLLCLQGDTADNLRLSNQKKNNFTAKLKKNL